MMSHIFGEIRQLAFVTDDIDAAMNYWGNTLGIGPFFIKRHITFNEFEYHGHPSPSPEISIALANSGALQIELIQQHDDAASIYREVADASKLHHVSAWLTKDDFDLQYAELTKKGYEVAQACVIPASGVRLVYFATEQGDDGLIYEISDLKEPSQYVRIMNIQKAHEGWQGTPLVYEVDA
ncbi:MAG: VOC family protein [Deinococcota bacterium]